MARNEPSKGATAERNPNADKDAWEAEKGYWTRRGTTGARLREVDAEASNGSLKRETPEEFPPKKNGSFQKKFQGKN